MNHKYPLNIEINVIKYVAKENGYKIQHLYKIVSKIAIPVSLTNIDYLTGNL